MRKTKPNGKDLIQAIGARSAQNMGKIVEHARRIKNLQLFQEKMQHMLLSYLYMQAKIHLSKKNQRKGLVIQLKASFIPEMYLLKIVCVYYLSCICNRPKESILYIDKEKKPQICRSSICNSGICNSNTYNSGPLSHLQFMYLNHLHM